MLSTDLEASDSLSNKLVTFVLDEKKFTSTKVRWLSPDILRRITHKAQDLCKAAFLQFVITLIQMGDHLTAGGYYQTLAIDALRQGGRFDCYRIAEKLDLGRVDAMLEAHNDGKSNPTKPLKYIVNDNKTDHIAPVIKGDIVYKSANALGAIIKDARYSSYL
jgi:hypothetical protein